MPMAKSRIKAFSEKLKKAEKRSGVLSPVVGSISDVSDEEYRAAREDFIDKNPGRNTIFIRTSYVGSSFDSDPRPTL